MNDRKKFVIARVDPNFKKELDDIKLKRILVGSDIKMRSDRRITKAMMNMSVWNEIKKTIIKSEFEDE